MKKLTKKNKNNKLIRRMLNECGFPKSKKFGVRKRNGVLVVRFDGKKYGKGTNYTFE